MTTEARCSSCGRKIIWAYSPAGARLPLDARPVRPYFIDYLALGGSTPRAIPAPVPELLGAPTKFYISHYLTCPQADEHSRAAKQRREEQA